MPLGELGGLGADGLGFPQTRHTWWDATFPLLTQAAWFAAFQALRVLYKRMVPGSHSPASDSDRQDPVSEPWPPTAPLGLNPDSNLSLLQEQPPESPWEDSTPAQRGLRGQ